MMAGLNGCALWPVYKEDVIGTYQSVLQDGTPGLPDGGSEILELNRDGTCKQNIVLKDGRTFVTQGTWYWQDGKSYLHNEVEVWGTYSAVYDGRIRPDLEDTMGKVVRGFPTGRTLSGRILLGSREGCHYEKK